MRQDTAPAGPVPVGVAVAPHVSGWWAWRVHTDTVRWSGTHTDAQTVADLASVIRDQVHDRLGEQVVLIAPPELGYGPPTGHEHLLIRAADHARDAARTLATGHVRDLSVRLLPHRDRVLVGPEWTLSVHAVVDEDGADWVWVSGAGWYATGRSDSGDLTEVAAAGIDAAATASPRGGRVRIDCDEPVAVKRQHALAQALRRAQQAAHPGGAVDQVDITHIDTASTPHHQMAVQLCAGLPHQEHDRDRDGGLRPYQERGVAALLQTWQGRGRGQWNWACGAGKTVGYAASAAAVDAQRVLVLVPTLDLVTQVAEAWVRRWGPRLRQVVAVCAQQDTLSTEPITAAAHHHRMHATVVRDPVLLTTLLDLLTPTLVVATYHSLHLVVDAHADHDLPAWDVVYADEAHHTAGRADNAWTVVHDHTRLPAHRRCYGTATPRRVVSNDGAPVASMDDTNVFGPVAHTYTVGEAIADGYLDDYQLVGAVVDTDQIRHVIGRGHTVDLDGRAVPADLVAAQVAVLRSIRAHDLRSLICYGPNLAWARQFADTLAATADLLGADAPGRPITALHVNGHSSHQERRAALHALARPGNRVSVVTALGCFVEGIDVPGVDAVGLFGSNRSRSQLIQRIGRSLRPGTGPRTVARIIAPLYVAPGATPEEVLDTPAYAAFARIISGLRSVDARFAHALTNHLVTTTGNATTTSAPSRWLRLTDAHTGRASDLTQAITTVVLNDGSSLWWANAHLAEQWYERHGHLDVDPDVASATSQPLRAWLGVQASLFRRGLLPPRHYDALSRIGMDWSSRAAGPFWPRLQAAVTAWYREHEHLLPPSDHPLYPMLVRARHLANTGRWSAEQTAWLDEHDMVWDLRRHQRTRKIHELGRFIASHHRLPFSRSPEERALYKVLSGLQASHRKQQLDEEQQRLCDQVRIPLGADDPHALPPPPHGPRVFELDGVTGAHLLAAIRAGATLDELVHASGRSQPFIYQQLRASGLESFTDLRHQAIAEQVRHGHDRTEVARTFQVPVLTVGSICALTPAQPHTPLTHGAGEPAWMTPEQATRTSGLSARELLVWANAHHLTVSFTPGGRPRYEPFSVQALAALLEDYYTPSQASTVLGVTTHTLNRMAREGRIQRLTPCANHSRYLKTDVHACAQNPPRHGPTPPLTHRRDRNSPQP